MDKQRQSIQVPHKLSIDKIEYKDYYDIQTAYIRYLYVKIEILDNNNIIVNELSGTAINGSYNITANSPIRRTCSITFNLEDGCLPQGADSPFWINKKFHLYMGLKDITQTQIYWFDKGIYAIKDPEVSISINENTITISGLDKMALLSGDISGQLPNATLATVDSGVTRRDVITSLVKDAGELEDKILIADDITLNEGVLNGIMDMTIPYDIESSIGDSVTDILDKILELFANYQYYYDIDGDFVFAPKPVNSDYQMFPIEWDFEKHNNVLISVSHNINYSNVKNRITIWGGIHDDGYQPQYTLILSNDNEDFGTSPFTIEKLNETRPNGTIMYRDYVEQNDDYIDTVLKFGMSSPVNKVDYLEGMCVQEIGSKDYYRCINPNGSNNLKDLVPDFKLYGATNKYGLTWGLITYNHNSRVKYQDNYYRCVKSGGVINSVSPDDSTDWELITDTSDINFDFQFICSQDDLDRAVSYMNNGNYDDDYEKVSRELDDYLTQIHSYSILLCKKRANEMLHYYCLASETINLTCVPIYSLDVNSVIYINDEKSGAKGYYVVTEISCQLNVGGTMSITANKLWN